MAAREVKAGRKHGCVQSRFFPGDHAEFHPVALAG